MIDTFYSSNRNSWSANFTHNGNHYFADLVKPMDRMGPEIMIFKADKNFDVDDWTDLYVAYPFDITEETLLKHINRFMESQ